MPCVSAAFWWRNSLKALEGRLARTFLRFATPLADLRRVPLLGPCLRWASAKLIPRDSLTWIQVQHGPAQGIWLHLNPRTGRDYFKGDVEPEVQTALQKYLRPGMTFYDIGANIGFFSLLAARLVGVNGRVVAFEADPEIASRLREHVTRNRDAPISVEEKAVWSSSDSVLFARADTSTSPDRGLGHVVEHGTDDVAQDTIHVQSVSLDEYVSHIRCAGFSKVRRGRGRSRSLSRRTETLKREKTRYSLRDAQRRKPAHFVGAICASWLSLRALRQKPRSRAICSTKNGPSAGLAA